MRRRVLVVDDDRDLCDLEAEFLAEEGYLVERAYGGRDALRCLLAETPPDLVLLDLLMPDLSGWDVGRALRASGRTSRVPIVIVTADPSAIARGREIGAVAAIAKPFSLDEISAVVRSALATPDSEQSGEGGDAAIGAA